MASWLLMIVVATATFFLADSVLTPILLLLWKKIWVLFLKIQSLFTKKNLLQALAQSLVLTARALIRLINKTVTAWLLPLLLTRRQRYRLHHAFENARRWTRMRLLRGWARWRRQPLWMRRMMLLPAIVVAAVLFTASGFLLAALFGITFVVPWIGGLPLATALFLRRQLARAALFVFERLGLGPLVNRAVDILIALVWWRTPEPVQHRFDVWWRWFEMRLRRWVIGPRRRVVRRMTRLRRGRRRKPASPTDDAEIKPARGRRRAANDGLETPYI